MMSHVLLQQVQIDHQLGSMSGQANSFLSLLRIRDPYTGLHSDRVQKLASQVCSVFGLDRVETEKIEIGAYLHDIGKMAIPDEILRKPGSLDADEWEIMKAIRRWGRPPSGRCPSSGRSLRSFSTITNGTTARVIRANSAEKAFRSARESSLFSMPTMPSQRIARTAGRGRSRWRVRSYSWAREASSIPMSWMPCWKPSDTRCPLFSNCSTREVREHKQCLHYLENLRGIRAWGRP